MASNGLKIAIVGGGLAGLAAAMKIAEGGHAVDLFSVVPVKRSHSVCAQGGINGAVNTKGEGDSTWEHFDDTVYGGDFLANQPPAKAMCEMAPSIIYLIGITATVWHFANGIWLFLVDWGITIGERAQRLTGYACIAFGVLLLLVGVNAAVAFIRPGGLLGGILY